MRYIVVAALAAVTLGVAGGAVADEPENPSTHLSGSFQWGFQAFRLEPGHRYQALWYYRGEDETCNGRPSPCEYWLGTNLPPVRAGGTLSSYEDLWEITGHAQFPSFYPDTTDGYYEVTLSDVGTSYLVPAIGPDGHPLVFEQELE